MGTVNVGYTDTPIEGVTVLGFARGLLNFKQDWRQLSQASPNEVILTNITSPIDRSEKLRIGVTPITNIYQNTGISDKAQAISKKGVSVLCQLTNTLRSTDTLGSVDLPVSAHLVLKLPAHEDITAQVVLTLIGRLLSSLYETGTEDLDRLQAIMRGSLLPADV